MARTNYSQLIAEVAKLDEDLQNPAQSGVYTNPDYVARGSYGLAALDDVERDTHVSAVLQKQRWAIVSYPWSVTPGGDGALEQQAADLCKAVLDNNNFDKLTIDLMTAIVRGFAVVEVMYGRNGDLLTIDGFIPRAARRFNFGPRNELLLRTPTNPFPGKLMPENKFLVYTFGGYDNNAYGSGVGSKILALVNIKREVLVRASEYSERVANGTALAIVKDGKADDLEKALAAAYDLVRSGVAAVTDTTDIKLMEATGSIQTFEALVTLLNNEISKCVLGETATTETSPYQSSGALTNVHNGVRIEQARGISDGICEIINRLFARQTEYNFPGMGVKPPVVSRLIGEAEAFMEKIKQDHLVAALGFAPSLDYVRKNYGDHWELAPQNAKTPPSVAGVVG